MTQWTRAEYNTDLRAATYTDNQGNLMVRSGGSLPWRVNNPGNLRPRLNTQGQPAPRKVKTHIGFAKARNDKGEESYFLIFPDYDTGVNELRANLKRIYSKKTINEAIHGYAPSKENDTSGYVDKVEAFSGLSRNRIVGELNGDEFERLVQAIIRVEGYNDQSKGARQEKMLKGTDVTLSDGAWPVPNKEVVLRQQGKDHVLKTDQYGRLPTLVHLPGVGAAELLVKNLKGALESVCKLDMSGAGKNLLLVWDCLHAHAPTAPHQPSNGAKKQVRESFSYVVQPGDTVGKIAKKFKSSVDAIKQANQLKNVNQIFPGQTLVIVPEGAKTPTHAKSKPSPSSAQTSAPAASAPAATPAPPGQKSAEAARSKDGTGSPLALLSPDNKRAPWMKIAFEEAHKWAGKDENDITKTSNYHALDGIRSGSWKDRKGNAHDFKSLRNDTGSPWCASFVNYCLRQAKYAMSANPAGSNSFVQDKNFVKVDAPIYGALSVWKKGGEGHVAFCYGIDTVTGEVICLGGNQDDRITFMLGKSGTTKKLVGYFVPKAYVPMVKNFQNYLSKFDIVDLNKSINYKKYARKKTSRDR
ncbi:TIGR02594 family protein [Paludibacterium sp.]|uniref:TIGR02594 family protein n=1 Tax=Paludibacterium sp. TaxID=1917523 RepID=UPI0025E08970|nr:TIGR02594 family protein [Paludibacterium sp.]MBV8646712.1 TIGR02594 family protein [Paludibacterium sp.]